MNDDSGEFLDRLKLAVPGYKLLRALSHGGQGIVYKAIQEKTGKVVAVKVLREGPWADETARQRLEREAKVLAALNHPNIVTMVDSGQTPEGHDFLVMNFIPGLSLDEFFKATKTPDDPGRMLKIFLKICQAINAAHLSGITHRDLSPSNILIDEHDEPHILDFGLARTAFDRFINVGPRQISVTGQFLGKVAYASPEQARGEPVDIRTDVYALGVILYQILTGGAYPYQVVGSIAEVLNHIIHTKPTPPSELLEARDAEKIQERRKLRKRHPPAVNAVIEAIVLKALEKDANQRYQSAGELGRDVENYLKGLPTVARPGESRRTFHAFSIQNAAATILICVIAGMIFYAVRGGHGRTRDVATTEPVVMEISRPASRPALLLNPVVQESQAIGAAVLPSQAPAIAIAPAADSPRYPSDAAVFRDRHYKVFRAAVGWNDALGQCKQMGGRLACPTDPTIKAFLQNLKGPEITAWIGGYLASSGDWQWLGGWKVDRDQISDPYPPGADRLFLSRSGNLAPRTKTGRLGGSQIPMIQGFICEWDPQ